jgi:hypothetical protein
MAIFYCLAALGAFRTPRSILLAQGILTSDGPFRISVREKCSGSGADETGFHETWEAVGRSLLVYLWSLTLCGKWRCLRH